MAVQKSKVTRSRRGQRRSHDSLSNPALSVESTSGETHRRHHVSADGFYRGKQVMPDKANLLPDRAIADTSEDIQCRGERLRVRGRRKARPNKVPRG